MAANENPRTLSELLGQTIYSGKEGDLGRTFREMEAVLRPASDPVWKTWPRRGDVISAEIERGAPEVLSVFKPETLARYSASPGSLARFLDLFVKTYDDYVSLAGHEGRRIARERGGFKGATNFFEKLGIGDLGDIARNPVVAAFAPQVSAVAKLGSGDAVGALMSGLGGVLPPGGLGGLADRLKRALPDDVVKLREKISRLADRLGLRNLLPGDFNSAGDVMAAIEKLGLGPVLPPDLNSIDDLLRALDGALRGSGGEGSAFLPGRLGGRVVRDLEAGFAGLGGGARGVEDRLLEFARGLADPSYSPEETDALRRVRETEGRFDRYGVPLIEGLAHDILGAFAANPAEGPVEARLRALAEDRAALSTASERRRLERELGPNRLESPLASRLRAEQLFQQGMESRQRQADLDRAFDARRREEKDRAVSNLGAFRQLLGDPLGFSEAQRRILDDRLSRLAQAQSVAAQARGAQGGLAGRLLDAATMPGASLL